MPRSIQEFTATVRVRFVGAPHVMSETDIAQIVSHDLNVDGADISVEALDVSTGAPAPASSASQAHPELTCQKCGGRNITWFAPNELWKRVVPSDGILCPLCFAELAEAQGLVAAAWMLAPEIAPSSSGYQRGLERAAEICHERAAHARSRGFDGAAEASQCARAIEYALRAEAAKVGEGGKEQR
jgi:hypothetical protein